MIWAAPNTALCTCGHQRAVHIDHGDEECPDRLMGRCLAGDFGAPPCACPRFRRAVAAPHRTTDDFSYADRRTTHQERTLVMMKSPTGEETTAGSNPAGVASPTTLEETGSPARTELRSVSNDENRPKDALPLCPIAGEEHGHLQPWPEVAGMAFCAACKRSWPIGTCGHPIDHAGTSRLCITCQRAKDRADSDAIVYEEANRAQPELHRCTVALTDGEVCGAVVGRSLHCELCRGERCYEHCKGVDHFGGKLVSRGGTDHFAWKVVEVAAGRFMGQLVERLDGDRLELRTTVTGLSERSTVEQLGDSALVYEQSRLQMPEPPRVAGGAVVGGPPSVNDAADQLLEATRGKVSDKKRAELLLEVIEWLRSCEEEWLVRWRAIDPNIRWRDAKELHDKQIAELFSRLAGAL